MILTETIPLYRDYKTLRSLIVRKTIKLPKYLKHSIGTRMIDSCFSSVRYLAAAMNTQCKNEERVRCVKAFMFEVEVTMDFIPFLVEEGVVSNKELAQFVTISNGIERQARGLYNKLYASQSVGNSETKSQSAV